MNNEQIANFIRQNVSDIAITHIVVHNGKAHMDDILAAGLASLIWPDAKLIRTDHITQDMLNDPEYLILDVGQEYDPDLHNFDHHQLTQERDPDIVPDCAMSLFASFVFSENTIAFWSEPPKWSPLSWYNLVRFQDNFGPAFIKEHFGISSMGILDSSLVYGFMALEPAVIEMVKYFWISKFMQYLDHRLMVDYISSLPERYKNIVHIQDEIHIGVMNHPAMPHWKERAGLYMELFKKIYASEEAPIQITISPGIRENAGWTVHVEQEDKLKGLSFAGLRQHPDVMFAHNSGFLVVFRPEVDLGKVIRIVITKVRHHLAKMQEQ